MRVKIKEMTIKTAKTTMTQRRDNKAASPKDSTFHIANVIIM
jgi:hypothetical protein